MKSRRIFLLSFIALFAGITVANAQQAKVHKYHARLAGQAVLKDVDDKYNAEVFSKEMPDPDGAADQARLREIKEDAAKKYPRKKKSAQAYNKTTTALSPVVVTSYVADTLPGIPPDNYMAVNDSNQTVSVVNTTIAVHNAATGQMNYRKTLSLITSSLGLAISSNNYRYDPKIVYDPEADRYICVMLNGTDQYNYIIIGFSKTSDAAAGWNFYKFYGNYQGDTSWFDYPAIAVTQHEFFLTGNKVKYDSSWQAGFKESVIYQVRKQDGYDGDSLLTYQIWDSVNYNGNYLRCLYPLNPGNSLQGPAQYLLSNRDFDLQNDTTFLIEVPDTIGSGNTNLTVIPLVANIPYGVPPDGLQPDTSVTLATNDNRILGGYVANNEVQFVCTTIDTSTGGSAIYHGTISNYNTTPSLQAQIFDIDTLDFGYPNISYTGNQGGHNQSIISFDYSGAATDPGFGALFYDGSQYSPMLNIESGSGSIKELTQKEQRWGDYSGSQPYWRAPGVVWVEGIYGRSNKNYGNYMAELASPYFTGVPAINKTASNSIVYPNPAWQFIELQFELEKEGFVSFVIYDMQGKMVDKILQQHCEEGQNMIRFNIASLATGTYLLKSIDEHGDAVATQKFIKQ